jgi:hypothetical protein
MLQKFSLRKDTRFIDIKSICAIESKSQHSVVQIFLHKN